MSLTSRERFEAWLTKAHPDAILEWEEGTGYLSGVTHRRFEAWQASERYAIERAAKVAESATLISPVIGPLYNAGWSGAQTCIAANIRALSPQEKG